MYLENRKEGTATSRGCEKNKNYCGTLEDLINVLVKPAVIVERKCHLCDGDLCNSSSVNRMSFLGICSLIIGLLL